MLNRVSLRAATDPRERRFVPALAAAARALPTAPRAPSRVLLTSPSSPLRRPASASIPPCSSSSSRRRRALPSPPAPSPILKKTPRLFAAPAPSSFASFASASSPRRPSRFASAQLPVFSNSAVGNAGSAMSQHWSLLRSHTNSSTCVSVNAPVGV